MAPCSGICSLSLSLSYMNWKSLSLDLEGYCFSFYSSSQRSMCTFHFPRENEVRPKLHCRGMSIFNPCKLEASSRRTQEKKMGCNSDGKPTPKKKKTLLNIWPTYLKTFRKTLLSFITMSVTVFSHFSWWQLPCSSFKDTLQ